MLAACAKQQGVNNEQEKKRPFGWDLSYKELMDKNGIDKNAYLRTWLKRHSLTYTPDVLASWKGDTVVSSILVEAPVFHAGEHSVQWFIRTRDKAYSWTFIEEKVFRNSKNEIDVKKFDEAMAALSAWQQSPPSVCGKDNKGCPAGYIGFLNIYHDGKPNQMLLSVEDLLIKDSTQEYGVREGRLSQVLNRIG